MKPRSNTPDGGEVGATRAAWSPPERPDLMRLDAAERDSIRERAGLMTLRGRARSPEACRLVETVWTGFSLPRMEKTPRPTSVPHLRHAASAIVTDLLIAANGATWARRGLDGKSFARQPVSRTHFRTVWEAMQRAGLVVSFSGFEIRGGERQRMWGGQTCFSATPSLLRLVADHAIALDDVLQHFTADIACE